MLYIPPGFPHQGIAIEPSMSFSVGYRTIAKSHLFSGFADYLIDNQLGKDMVVDPQRQATQTPGLINQDDINSLTTSLQDMLNDEQRLTDFYGQHLSAAKHELAIEEDIEPFLADEILDILQEQPLNRLGGLRSLYFPQEWAKGWLYVDGEKYSVSSTLHDAIALLADETALSYAQLAPWLEHDEFKMLVTQFVNQGFWYFLPSE